MEQPTETPPVEDAQGTEDSFGIAEALAQARESLQDKGTMVPAGDDDAGESDDELPPEVDDDEGEGEVEDEESEDEPEEGASGEEEGELDDEEVEPQEVEAGETEGAEEVGEEEGAEGFTATIPGRGPDDDDIEIEVSDAATRDRLNHLKNGFMHGEAYREGLAEIQGAQEELYQIEETFAVDPAGFFLDNLEKKSMPSVALSLIIQPDVWKSVQATLDKLLSDPHELRTLQAEARAARYETRDALQKSRTERKTMNENAALIRDAIDLMVPANLDDSRRARIIADMTRDTVDHINRHGLETMKPKDLPTVLADRLELNGIDPLEARAAVRNGNQSRASVSTRKKKGPKKRKTGKQLAKASAKRKKVAAAPRAGRGAAPTPVSALPAGQTIQDRIKEVRKRGLGALLGK